MENLRTSTVKFLRVFPKLNFSASYNSGSYGAVDLLNLKDAVSEIKDQPFLKPQIELLDKAGFFNKYVNEQQFTSVEYSEITKAITELRIGLQILIQYNNYLDSHINSTVIEIKLPELENFEDLQNVANDLKKAIQIPVNDSNTEGETKILSAEKGSIWLIVGLGTMAAIGLIARICWAAAFIRKEQAGAKIFEAHSKTLELKNEMIEIFVKAQKIQMDRMLNAEAESIAAGFYDNKEPETIKRLELSISTVSELIEKGAQILPASKDPEIEKLFPDYANTLIESATKHIKNGE